MMFVYIVVMNSEHLCRGFIDPEDALALSRTIADDSNYNIEERFKLPEHVLFYATKYAGDDEWEELYCYRVVVDTNPRNR